MKKFEVFTYSPEVHERLNRFVANPMSDNDEDYDDGGGKKLFSEEGARLLCKLPLTRMLYVWCNVWGRNGLSVIGLSGLTGISPNRIRLQLAREKSDGDFCYGTGLMVHSPFSWDLTEESFKNIKRYAPRGFAARAERALIERWKEDWPKAGYRNFTRGKGKYGDIKEWEWRTLMEAYLLKEVNQRFPWRSQRYAHKKELQALQRERTEI